ncbi:dnaJ homolog subfamily C member 3-like [Lytechinus variegatus]|uniref:dnaJ homolog subfamily C member 3-like n=1 Tax=Lytechinus variegatus TaxID=7654 RepID=UPI001BB18DA2|nr:dnaJ homolog subfamily C member 3-like [Lytechinus variegatus]
MMAKRRDMFNLHNFLSSIPVLLVTLSLHYDDGEAKSEAEAKKYMETGNTLLAAGQLADALAQYNSAIDNDPKNYMAYYKRAAVYLAQGRSKLALPDLKKSMTLKQDFTPALINHGNVLFKQGHLAKAREDYAAVLKFDPSNKEAEKQLGMTRTVEERIAIGDKQFQSNQLEQALDAYSKVLMYLPWNADMHRKRAKVYTGLGELYKAIDDLRSVTKLVPDSTEIYLEMSRTHDSMGDLDMALEDIRECLKLDPDHKECFPLYKLLKKIRRFLDAAENYIRDGRYDEAIEKLKASIEAAGKGGIYELRANARICHAYRMSQNLPEAKKMCSLVLKDDPENIDVLIDRAETYIQDEMYEEAVSDYQKAKEIDDVQRTQEGLDRAQKLLKQSKKRDYYKILGVRRNAVKKDILKAYRQLAMQWHPDKHEEGEQKSKAEKMFMDIADAKEVLTDPEMREKFDAGEDPLDPEQQQQRNQGFHHGHPFGFNPFGSGGGGGFNFKFKFN